jgi:hypothetical protein
MLIRLNLLSTYGAHGPYLLRAVVPGGVLLGLRSLSIDLISARGGQQEGYLWGEEENGFGLKADARKRSRHFDGNYIMSISKGAPNLEELELSGTSDETLVSSLPFVHCLFRDVIYGLHKCRIPSAPLYPGSQSYRVSPFLAVTVANPPSSHGPLSGQTTLS